MLKSTHKFTSTNSKTLIRTKLQHSPRFKIDRTAKSHAMLTKESNKTTKSPQPQQQQQQHQPTTNESIQMLGHLATLDNSNPNTLLPRQSAVLVPICLNNNIPSLLFIKRTSKRGSHRSQLAFPGGMYDDIDNNDPIQCALREMNEEIGLSKLSFDIIGLHHDAGTSDSSRNPDQPHLAKSTIITPVIGILNNDIQDYINNKQFQLSIDELDYAFTIPIHDLIQFNNWTTYKGRPAFTYHHQSINDIIFPTNDNNGIHYQLIDQKQFLQLQQQQQEQKEPIPTTSTTSTTINTNPVISNLDELNLSQLQYLQALQSQGMISIEDSNNDQNDLSTTIPKPNNQTARVYISQDELLWGATAHITHLFLKQIILPLYNELQ